eukprot:3513372-Prymnesium_polylepis.2
MQGVNNVKVGAGKDGMPWPKRLQFMVKLRVDVEDHEVAARGWLAGERGQRHVKEAPLGESVSAVS